MDKGYMGETRKAFGVRMLRLESIPYLILGAVALLSGCLGGSDGVENPKMDLEFRGEDGAALSGRVSLYTGNLNPAVDASPLLSKDFTGGAAVITDEEMDAALNKALAAKGKDTTTAKDTTLYFNMVTVSGDKESFQGGFAYRRTGKTARFGKGEGGAVSFLIEYKKRFAVKKAVPFSGRLGRAGSVLGIDYVFIAGSPYHAAIGKDSTFTVTKMGQGSYKIFGVDKDSAQFFESNDSLSTTDSSYSAKDWGTIPVIPDH
jgi:hypothetical protein